MSVLVELATVREAIAALSFDEDDESAAGELVRLRTQARELATRGARLAVPTRDMTDTLDVSEAQFTALLHAA